MESKEIRRYAKLMQELELSSLEITENGTTVKLQRARTEAPSALPAAPQPAPNHTEQAQDGAVISDEAGIATITSPMVGTFYCAPADGAEPYVSVGTRVKKGDVVCIIEAMKLMNEITAEYSGIVEQVCINDKEFVDYGTPLFKIRRELRE
ncbi:MAG: acetyl-CoA carboxylase biotin carboxyl carrier protein [Oscillospiraceae bacterium]|nr:acetyl-CoA carboxylase biotin carboxyl carrier protein [Oscillospiraceae bacterium]